jgi:hypothetical protein
MIKTPPEAIKRGEAIRAKIDAIDQQSEAAK